MKLTDLYEKHDKKSEAIGLATEWFKKNFKSFDLPFKVMRIATSGQYIMATSATNPGWDVAKRVYVKVIDGVVRQTNVKKWNKVVDDRKAIRAQTKQAKVAEAVRFQAGPPKPAKQVTLAQLKKALSAGDKVVASKDVDGFNYKLLMKGPNNFYVKKSMELLKLLKESKKVGYTDYLHWEAAAKNRGAKIVQQGPARGEWTAEIDDEPIGHFKLGHVPTTSDPAHARWMGQGHLHEAKSEARRTAERIYDTPYVREVLFREAHNRFPKSVNDQIDFMLDQIREKFSNAREKLTMGWKAVERELFSMIHGGLT